MSDNPFFEKEKPKAVTGGILGAAWFVDLLQSVVVAVIIVIVVYLFIVIPNQVDGPSMQPNFQSGQLVLTSKVNQWLGATGLGEQLNLNYKRGDVVVFQKPDHLDLIKRVIGLPGETVMILNCEIYINDRRVEEEYIPDEFCTNAGSYATEGKRISLEENQYFLVGDNRGNSRDSRFVDYGPIEREWIKGKVVVRYLPIQDFSIIGSGKITLEGTSETE